MLVVDMRARTIGENMQNIVPSIAHCGQNSVNAQYTYRSTSCLRPSNAEGAAGRTSAMICRACPAYRATPFSAACVTTHPDPYLHAAAARERGEE